MVKVFRITGKSGQIIYSTKLRSISGMKRWLNHDWILSMSDFKLSDFKHILGFFLQYLALFLCRSRVTRVTKIHKMLQTKRPDLQNKRQSRSIQETIPIWWESEIFSVMIFYDNRHKSESGSLVHCKWINVRMDCFPGIHNFAEPCYFFLLVRPSALLFFLFLFSGQYVIVCISSAWAARDICIIRIISIFDCPK